MTFARIGQHITTKQCGDGINIDQLKQALQKYQQMIRNAKQKEKDPASFAKQKLDKCGKIRKQAKGGGFGHLCSEK